jgi:hypothetical protein
MLKSNCLFAKSLRELQPPGLQEGGNTVRQRSGGKTAIIKNQVLYQIYLDDLLLWALLRDADNLWDNINNVQVT